MSIVREPGPDRRSSRSFDFDEFFPRLSHAFAVMPDDDVDAAIGSWLDQMVKVLKLDEAALHEVRRDGTVGLTHASGLQAARHEIPLGQAGVRVGTLTVSGVEARSRRHDLERRLDLVAQVFAGALARKHASQQLAEGLGFEQLITRLVAAFVGLAPEATERLITEWLGHLADYFDADEVWLIRSSRDSPAPIVHRAGRHRDRRARRTDARHHLSVPLVSEGGVWGRIAALCRRPRPWSDAEKEHLGIAGEVMMEALRRQAIEEQVRRQRADLVAVSRAAALGELTAALAHELTQPLAAIRANARATRVLAATFGSDELDEVFADVEGDVVRAAGLIVRLRDLLRRHEVAKGPLDLNGLVAEACPRLEAEVHRHGARLVLGLAPGLPDILGDALQLEQVLMNLVRNAAEAMAGRAKDPEVIVRTALDGPEHLALSVADCGPPVDAASFERMFVAFHTTKADGLGMGLAISRSIVEAHGGRLWAERRSECGMALMMAFPMANRP